MEINTKTEMDHPLQPQLLSTTSINARLKTEHVKLESSDESWIGKYERYVLNFVGSKVTPRQLLGLLQVLKAITVVFLVLTLAANLMYMVFMEILASKQVRVIAGGHRDFMIRFYGLIFSIMAVCIEMDYCAKATTAFYGFKGFLYRGVLLYFIATITSPDPSHYKQIQMQFGDDDALDYDDYISNIDQEIPGSAVAFQMTVSFILGICGFTYLLFGLLCIDKFTAKAFLTTEDPLVTTAIPMAKGIKATDAPNNNHSYGNLA